MLATPTITSPLIKPTRAKLRYEDITFTSKSQRQAVEEIVSEFTLASAALKNIKDHFIFELKKGLANDGETIAMVPVYVSGRLDGSETGSYLTMDIGGTYLRVVSVVLEGQSQVKTLQKKYKIDEHLKVGEAKALFVDEHSITASFETQIELGFTFSFPVLQTTINSGTLIAWTKGFNSPGVVDKDPAAYLQDAFRRRNVPVRVAALLNDTVGTLLAHAYRHSKTVIGLGLGTGSNGAYIERVDRITKRRTVDDTGATDTAEMVINMEFGAFDSERRVLPVTMFDNKIDRKSLASLYIINPGKQIFEKMIAGMYLGEIARNILVHLIDRRLLLDGRCTKEMNTVWAFDTSYMSTIEADTTLELKDTQLMLECYLGLAIPESSATTATTLTDRQIVKLVVELVGQRAARLSAAALAGILEHTRGVTWSEDDGGVDIGVDGSLYRYYPGFEADIRKGLVDISQFERDMGLAGIDVDVVRMGPSIDGSGVGAALCALLASTASTKQ
ncbi:glucokinase [Dissophora globulifera]|nr:glucokinase [Dissophora globulifera]